MHCPDVLVALYGGSGNSRVYEMSRLRRDSNDSQVANSRRDGYGPAHLHHLRGRLLFPQGGIEMACSREGCKGRIWWSGVGLFQGVLYVTYVCDTCFLLHIDEIHYGRNDGDTFVH